MVLHRLATCRVRGRRVVHPRRRAAEPDAATPPPESLARETLVYVGTYTGGESKGIYLFRMETNNLEVSQNMLLVPLGLAAETPNPSFLEIDPKRNLLFAVNEVDEFNGKPTGSVTSFRIDRDAGTLTQLSQASSGGAVPCHLVLDETGRNVLVANYGGGSVAVLPVRADGRLGEPTDVVQHDGEQRESRSARGAARPLRHDVAGQQVRLRVRFGLGQDRGLSLRRRARQADARRAGVRDRGRRRRAAAYGVSSGRPFRLRVERVEFHDHGLRVRRRDGRADGSANRVDRCPSITTGPTPAAEIAVHPSGKYLYASNRGHESVVLFEIDRDGKLDFVEEQGTGGKTPRNFGIQPSGDHLAIANQGSNTLLFAASTAETAASNRPASSPRRQRPCAWCSCRRNDAGTIADRTTSSHTLHTS